MGKTNDVELTPVLVATQESAGAWRLIQAACRKQAFEGSVRNLRHYGSTALNEREKW